MQRLNLTLIFKKSFSNQKGFTLIEVMIAVTILSFIMIGVITLTNQSFDQKDRIITEDNEMLQIETALARLEWDFSHIYSPLYFSRQIQKITEGGEEGNDQGLAQYEQIMEKYRQNERFSFPNEDGHPVPKFESPDKNTFQFFTNGNRRKLAVSKDSTFAWVRYSLGRADQFIKDDEDDQSNEKPKGDALIRYFSPVDVFNPERWEYKELKAQVLLENVKTLKFEYWDPESGKFVEKLNLIQDGEHIVRAIQLTIEWIDVNEIEQKIIRIFRPLWPYFIPADPNAKESNLGDDEEEEI